MRLPSSYVHPNYKLLPGRFWGTSILSSRNSPCKGPGAILGSRSWTGFLGLCPWTSLWFLPRKEIRHLGSQCLASSALGGYPNSVPGCQDRTQQGTPFSRAGP